MRDLYFWIERLYEPAELKARIEKAHDCGRFSRVRLVCFADSAGFSQWLSSVIWRLLTRLFIATKLFFALS